MNDVTWDRPGPGTWVFDATHATRPMGRCFDALYADAFERGFAEGFERVGAPLETIKHGTINGWPFIRPTPLGGPTEAQGPPPKLLMTLLFTLVPSLRRRKRTAATLFERRPWRHAWDEWERHGEPTFAAEMGELIARDVVDLDDESLADSLDDLADVIERLVVNHFRNAVMTSVTVGDLLVHTDRWAAVPAARALDALTGYAHATQRPLRHYDRIVEALRQDDALTLLDGDSETLRARMTEAAPSAAKRLDAYLDEYGLHMVSGITAYDVTLEERPDVWHASLRARAGAADSHEETVSRMRDASERAAAAIRRRVPEPHRAEWDEMLPDARRALGIRESDIHLLGAGVGLLRRQMLEVGRRLVSAGLADEAEGALDLELVEAQAALRGSGPSGAEIRALTAERKRQEGLRPQHHVGPAPMPPPFDRFPAPVARVAEASNAFVSRFDAGADPIEAGGLAGHGVSPGIIEAVARVVMGPEDFDRFNPGEILVARTTSPTFNVVLAMASGVVTEVGGLICHAAIVAREFGMPGVVGVKGIIDAIPDGTTIRLDGEAGTVTLLDTATTVAGGAGRPDATDALPEPRPPDQPGEVVRLDQATSQTRFGGKASQLARLVENGVDVPEGFVLDPRFVEAIAAGDGDHQRRLGDALGDLSGPWAVRSSCLAEDGRRASFAGQFLTVLGVTDHAGCVDAIARVWASAHGAGVRAYRKRLGMDEETRMAVVVQCLVDAESAGILFSEEDGTHLVEAGWGLGEPIVSGTVDPDRFTLDVEGRVLTGEIADKPTELRADPTGQTVTRVVPEDRRRLGCVDDDQLTQLAQLAARCRDVFGEPRDIEWAFDPRRRLLCLQARPITKSMPAETISRRLAR